MSYDIKNLYCPKCKKKYSYEKINQTCECGSPLLVEYDLEGIKKNITKEDIEKRENTLWRYHELLPVVKEENVVTLGEGLTPFLKINRLGEDMDIDKSGTGKDEGIIANRGI